MKLIKKSVSILLSSMMLVGCTVTALTANASTGGQLCSKYATNPNGKTGISKTITIDGGRVLDVPLILVNSGAQVDVTGTAGFTGQKLSGSIVLGPEENILYGDINGDGKITVDDVTLLQLFVSGDKTIDSAAKIRADVNKDGVIDVLDCTDIQLYIAGDLSKLG